MHSQTTERESRVNGFLSDGRRFSKVAPEVLRGRNRRLYEG
jgi:hypothetical protein